MLSLLWLVPALPIAGFLVLALLGRRLPRRAATAVSCGSVGLSALLALLIGVAFVSTPQPGDAYVQHLWTWMDVGGFRPMVALYLDPVSLLMMLVATGVGFLIHVYSTEYMAGDDGYSRFFAYMNLFVAAMVTLVLAKDLLLLYLGWEGVGLCSFLLIGFWYKEPANTRAARKAFLVTRVGDTAMVIGLFLLFTHLGTLDIPELLRLAPERWAVGSTLAVAAAALLLGGALGKSAQLPLQTWLPDAMAGPTPTSALIHAATMVTAGVYLIARMHALFTLAPPVQAAVAVIGAATLLLASFSALVQTDIKRILAWSTVSQIGYMFLALGVGAWSAAMFHFMTHAFFKALLFLAAGAVIVALHHEQDIFRMGGLRRELPVAYWSFVIGGCALAGLPLVTSGFFSKDLIMWQAWTGPGGNPWLWTVATLGAVLTSLYTFRLILFVFYGEAKTHVSHRPGWAINGPLLVLCVLSVVGGYVNTPPHFGGVPALSNWLHRALPPLQEVHHGPVTELLTAITASLCFAAGFGAAWLLFRRQPAWVDAGAARPWRQLWLSGWGFDWLYDRVLVRPTLWLTQAARGEVVDAGVYGLARLVEWGHRGLSLTQTGRLRWYAASFAVGAVVLLAMVVLP